VAASPLMGEYGTEIDRESAYERLAAKLAPPPAESRVPDRGTVREEPAGRARDDEPGHKASSRAPEKEGPGLVEGVVRSTAFKSFLRSAGTVLGREITRSILGTARRR